MTQGIVVLFASIFIFLVLFTTRDILLRTRSLIYQLACILLVALVPVLGFLLYLLIRPARTVKEREVFMMLTELSVQKSEPARTPMHATGFTVSEVKMKKTGKKKGEPGE